MRDEIRALTGLRGIAALLIVLLHMRWHLHPDHAEALAPWTGTLGLGVDVFFVLSGFVMAMVYAPAFAQGYAPARHGTFLRRRLARVYPLYLLVVLAWIAQALATHGSVEVPHGLPDVALTSPWAKAVANLAMVQCWGLTPSFVWPSWSISTEWAAYMLFPTLLALTTGLGRTGLLAATLAVPGLLALSWLIASSAGLEVTAPLSQVDPLYGLAVLRCLAGFLFGMVCHRMADTAPVRAWAGRDRVGVPLLGGLALALLGMVPDLAGFILIGPLVLCLYWNTGILQWLFANAVVHRLGVLSYSIYMLHEMLRRVLLAGRAVLEPLLPLLLAQVLAVLAYLLALGVLASLTYRWVEVPGRALLSRPLPKAAPAYAR